MNKQTRVLGDQDRKGIDDLLKKAGKDKVIDAVVKGKDVGSVTGTPAMPYLGGITGLAEYRTTGQILGKSFENHVTKLAFSHDSKKLAVGTEDCDIKIIDLEKEKVIHEKSYDLPIGGLAFSPDGTLFAVASADEKYCRLDICSAVSFNRLPGHIPEFDNDYYHFNDINFSPDSRYIAFADIKGHSGVFRFTPSSGLNLVDDLNNRFGLVYQMSFTPDGRYYVVAAGEQGIGLFELDGRKLRYCSKNEECNYIRATAFSPDGRHIAVLYDDRKSGKENDVEIFKFDNRKLGKRVFGSMISMHSIEDIAFSPDGQWLAYGGHDNLATIMQVMREKNE